MSRVSAFASQALIALVRGYQVVLSPMLGGACRFEPSCSNYMIEALRAHGAIKGTLLGLWRILRCHPWGGYGYDPVPPKGRWRNEFGKVERNREQSKAFESGKRN